MNYDEKEGDKHYLPTVTSFLESRTRYSTQGRATMPLPRTKIFLLAIVNQCTMRFLILMEKKLLSQED